MSKEVDPEFYERASQDMDLVDKEINAARRNGRPIDNIFVENVAVKRLRQARGYSLPEGALDVTLETSRGVVDAAVVVQLAKECILEGNQ